MAEPKAEPRVIEGNLSGTHEFTGDVVVKGNVLDGANLRVMGGGLRVEGDVGNKVNIDQRDGAKFAFSSTGDGVCFSSVSSGGTFIGSVHGDMTIAGGKIIINGVDVTQTLKDKQGELGLSGVEIQGKSGNDVQVQSTEGISAKGFGDRANLDAQGGIRSGEVGEQSRLASNGSIRSNDVGKGSQLSAAGSVSAGVVQEASSLRAGGSTSVARAESGSVISAGGSVSAGEVSSNTQVYAGGSGNIGIVRTGATVEVGGSINVAMAEEGANTRAGGSKNIGSVVPPAGPAGQAPAQHAPRTAPAPATFNDGQPAPPSSSPQPPVGEPSAQFQQTTTEPAGQVAPSAGNEGQQRPSANTTAQFTGLPGQTPASGQETPRSPAQPSPDQLFRPATQSNDGQRPPNPPMGNPQQIFSPPAAPQAPVNSGTQRPSPQASFSHAPEPPRHTASANIDFTGNPGFLAGMLTALLSTLGIESTPPRTQGTPTGHWPPPQGAPSHPGTDPGRAAPPPQPARAAQHTSPQAPAANANVSNVASGLSKSTIAEIMEAGMTLAGANTTPMRNTAQSQQAFDAMPKAARNAEVAQAHEIAKTLNPAVDTKAGRGR